MPAARPHAIAPNAGIGDVLPQHDRARERSRTELLLDEEAFDTMMVASSHPNRKLREIAAETVTTGDIPSWRPEHA
ncbi:hypothetical protein CH263_08310 [Rhodococcus sp. 06-1059B-a]|nr:hypothetical protein [Rhodococcus sp. 06-1059B-a]OZD68892.1 hypothetical protein CH263_08310 [Rhodococcus sp. 06-1059B-a]